MKPKSKPRGNAKAKEPSEANAKPVSKMTADEYLAASNAALANAQAQLGPGTRRDDEDSGDE